MKRNDSLSIGYTTGVFDLFHVGHLNILKKAKSKCDKLIVGVTTDELVKRVKGKKPVISYEERRKIIENIRFVDKVVPQRKIDEIDNHRKLKFNLIFKGDDWRNTKKWDILEKKFEKLGVKVVFFNYTKSTSSTLLRKYIKQNLLN